ncbi:hypothetical protein Gohar_009506 [Gossypium harknessii]|uniref:Protein kinase domain-containing protein n=1 Tax=Gossypium harknessii TaxID=34285 RepID=A0A7J9GN33_9ROSI|nr:hypothetical protein [Gossypium harknessii]
MEKKPKKPSCLCAILFTGTASKAGVRLEIAHFVICKTKMPMRQLSLGADTISANQSLSGNQTIVSSGENFVLGFFTPGKSSNYYIGIWYGGKVSEQTPVWVANREIPVRDIYSSELKVSDEDPAPGFFSLELDSRGTNQNLILWNRTEYFWASGPWGRPNCSATMLVLAGGDQFLESRNTTFPAHPQITIAGLLSLKQLGQDDVTGKTLYIKMMDSNISNESSSTNRKRVINRKKVHSWSLDTEIYTRQPRNSLKKWEKGAFGIVFRGTLPGGSTIAVKKLESINQGEKQFRAEVNTIGKINHINLVRLRGFCLEARGLAYLHENCVNSIIYCDIKPENILLDVDNCSKLADFGLANLLGREFSRVLSTMRGTVSYLAPERISGVAITPKADVYSFGMMLLELV